MNSFTTSPTEGLQHPLSARKNKSTIWAWPGLPAVRLGATRGRLLLPHSVGFPGDAASSLQSKKGSQELMCQHPASFPRGGVALLLAQLIFT